MKNLFLTLLILLTCTFYAQAQTDEELIKKTALNYLEGWYTADTARMAEALSPTLVKRGFVTKHNTGAQEVWEASYSQMVEWTGKQQKKSLSEVSIQVSVIEIGKNIAMVKTISPDFIDYLHMGKVDGKWKIYNAVWEFTGTHK